MKELDNELWTQLFQDRPIPQVTLENFQAQLMAQIGAHPVDFGEELRLTQRRKWGIGFGISLIVLGLIANALLVMLSGWSVVVELQRFEARLLHELLLFQDLKPGIGLLWGVVSWPLFGVLSVVVIFWSLNPVRDEKSSI